HPHLGELLRDSTRALDVRPETEAAELPALRRLGAPGGEALDVGVLDGLVEPRDVIARVVHGPRRRAIRERAHHVGPPARRRTASRPARRAVARPLDGVDRFDAAGPPLV